LYEEKDERTSSSKEDLNEVALVSVKGIGKVKADGLEALGINSIEDLLASDPDDLSAKLSGASTSKVLEWQKDAKGLI
jgi:nucleotidyltransferase/DNA polymerase involved in DNA repair